MNWARLTAPVWEWSRGAQHEALRVGRAREQTAGFTAEYARRAGVEGTIA